MQCANIHTRERELCSRSWHKSCFLKNMKMPEVEFSSLEETSSDEQYSPCFESLLSESSDGFVPDSEHNSDGENSPSIKTQKPPTHKTTPSYKRANSVPQHNQCSSIRLDMVSANSSSAQDLMCDYALGDDHDSATHRTETLQRSATESSDKQPEIDNVSSLKEIPQKTFSTQKNYCFLCKKPQSKIARHFKKHKDSEREIAAAFLLPKHRRRLLEKLRNRGNYEHNQEVMETKKGPLKVKRYQEDQRLN
ncbi:uncharacterized protein LOC132846177 [Tachysurus vachellii]|uniref:uncharacterized protein LOC132846177 n=1 Tax=Tachysurus vachellii TaxID=175792 RepID=UPI00296A9D8E|nr:uncharacterized protein LOC132846177 [Tachysurus vachellii]